MNTLEHVTTVHQKSNLKKVMGYSSLLSLLFLCFGISLSIRSVAQVGKWQFNYFGSALCDRHHAVEFSLEDLCPIPEYPSKTPILSQWPSVRFDFEQISSRILDLPQCLSPEKDTEAGMLQISRTDFPQTSVLNPDTMSAFECATLRSQDVWRDEQPNSVYEQ